MKEILNPQMSEAKIQLLQDSFNRSSNYLEYGMGESSLLAAQNSLQNIISIDSREDCVASVQEAIANCPYSGNIHLMHANLGSTSAQGIPANEVMVKNWPQYYSSPWVEYRNLGHTPDLILINGRFQTSCFLYSILLCKTGTRILWNDYLNRSEHHFVENTLLPKGVVDDMAIFTVNETIDKKLATILLFQNLFNLG